MKGSKIVFENEDAVRLLNYFISYKEIVNKNESNSTHNLDEDIKPIEIMSEPERITIK